MNFIILPFPVLTRKKSEQIYRKLEAEPDFLSRYQQEPKYWRLNSPSIVCAQYYTQNNRLTDVEGVDHLLEILACKKSQHSHNILLGTKILQYI